MAVYLKEKTYLMKELCAFFGTDPSNFTGKRKARYLEELNNYAKFETILGNDGKVKKVKILQVSNSGPYVSEKKATVAEILSFVEKDWGKYDEPYHTADSTTIVTNRYCNEHGIVWQEPKYIMAEEEWTNTNGRKKTETALIHNPAMKDWWYVYGVISRQFLKDNKKTHRIYLGVDLDWLSCSRLTEEQEEQIQNISKRVFGQKTVLPREMKDIAKTFERMCERGEEVSLETIYQEHPMLRAVSDENKWQQFREECIAAGLPVTIHGSDRKEEERLMCGDGLDQDFFKKQ